jgi:hypothetical protein
MRKKRNAYRILVGKPEEERPQPRGMCVDNIKLDLREIGWGGMCWINLAQDRDQWKAVVNKVMKLLHPQNIGKFLSRCAIGGFSGRAQLHAFNLVS